jgi:hypothetical protein
MSTWYGARTSQRYVIRSCPFLFSSSDFNPLLTSSRSTRPSTQGETAVSDLSMLSIELADHNLLIAMDRHKPTPGKLRRVLNTNMPSNGPLTNISSSRQIFPFEKLAPELRNQIYELVLVGEHPIQVSRFVDEKATRANHTCTEKCNHTMANGHAPAIVRVRNATTRTQISSTN